MKNFKSFLKEEDLKLSNLDMEFLGRAEQVTSLNLSAADFQKIDGRKKEIQYLFRKHFFPNFKGSTISGSKVTAEEFNKVATELYASNPEKFLKLFEYNIKGVGPGEVLLYFVYNACRLGGGSSAGLDVMFPSGGYEVKAVQIGGNGYLRDFKLGGTFSVNEVENKLFELSEKEGFGKAEISTSKIDVLKKKYPKEFKALEAMYADIAYKNYFSKHEIIFMNNSPTGAKRGRIIAVKNVLPAEISIERFTSKSLKPLIKL